MRERRIKSENKLSNVVEADPPTQPYIEDLPYVEFDEGNLALMWDKRKGKPKYDKKSEIYGLALTSSRRSLKRVLTIYLPWMGGRFHYQLMGLSSNPM
jgi:hypothetical protein